MEELAVVEEAIEFTKWDRRFIAFTFGLAMGHLLFPLFDLLIDVAVCRWRDR